MREINGPIKALCKQLNINYLSHGKTNLGALIAHKRPCNDILDMKEAIYKFLGLQSMWSCLLGWNKAKTWNKNKRAFCFLPKGLSFSIASSYLEHKEWYWSPVYHFLHLGHSFDFDKVQLIHQERNWVKRKILEALYIQTTPNTCNLNSGMKFDENW